jgi:hypothetical protein
MPVSTGSQLGHDRSLGMTLTHPRSHLAFAIAFGLLAAGTTVANELAKQEKLDKPRPAQAEVPQVGAARPIRVVPDLSQARREGNRLVWQQTVTVADAAFLKPRFANLNLLPDDVLRVSGANGVVVEELRGRGPRDAGSFWGLSVFGTELRLELNVARPYAYRPFEVEQVIVGDPSMLAAATGAAERSVCAPADYDDVVCYQDDAAKWANIVASAGVMTAGGGIALWCSGANVSPRNYVLTNHHCIANTAQCENAEFVFKYWRTTCNSGALPTGDWQGFHCGETVASSPLDDCDATLSALDFSLNTVDGDPAATFGSVQVDPGPLSSGEGIYIVQHPDGRPHEIAHGSGPDVVVDGSVLRYYDTLDTEGGSSGSPIFRESDDRLVGLHHCGGCESPGVGNRGMLISDIYPQIEQYLCTKGVTLVQAPPLSLQQVHGNGDSVLDPGEVWSFVPVLRNTSCGAGAIDVQARVAVNSGSAAVTVLDPVATFGAIAAGKSALAAAPVRFQIHAGIACAGEVILDLVDVSATAGGPFPDFASYISGEIGSVPISTLLFENFSGGIPSSWDIVDGGIGTGPAATWTAANPGGRNLLTPPFAIADSDELGGSWTMDEQLITPPVHPHRFARHVTLEFEHDFEYYGSSEPEKGDVEVRNAFQGVWVNVARFEKASASGRVVIDLTPHMGPGIQIRFRYHDAQFEWWWAIDDVHLYYDLGRVCQSSGHLFADGFESGGTAGWANSAP